MVFPRKQQQTSREYKQLTPYHQVLIHELSHQTFRFVVILSDCQTADTLSYGSICWQPEALAAIAPTYLLKRKNLCMDAQQIYGKVVNI